MTTFLSDCRHAVRLYLRTPVASALAVVVLAVSVAFVCSFLSLYVDLALKPHPGFGQGDLITTIGETDGGRLSGVPYTLVDRLADETSSIEAAANVRPTGLIVGSDRELANTLHVTKGFFTGLEPRIALGRGFRAEDHAADAEPVAILSYGYWQRQFAGDSGVLDTFLEIGRNPNAQFITLAGPFRQPGDAEPQPERETAQFRIVGVVSEDLAALPSYTGSMEPTVWLPLERVWPMFLGEPGALPGTIPYATYARRAPGASVRAVANELRARYEVPNSDWDPDPGHRTDAIDGLVLDIATHREAGRQLGLLLAGSVLLSLVAAANASLFLLARAPERRRELGIRLAVGAPKRRLARQLATEAGLLVVVSSLVGLVGSVWLGLYIKGLPSLREANWGDVTLLDWRVLVLVASLLLVLGLAVSVAPILGLKRVGIAAASRSFTARASAAQRLVGTAQITVAGILGAAAIGFGWHLMSLVFGDAGYRFSDRFLVQSLGQPISGTPEARRVARQSRREAIEAIPGVLAVGYGYPIPGNEESGLFPRQVPDPRDSSRVLEISRGSLEPRLIDVLGYELLYGRVPEDGESAVVVVNQTVAQALWGRDDVVGQRLFGSAQYEGHEIVGVLKDLSFAHPLAVPKPYAFEPLDYIPYVDGVIEAQLTAAELQQALALLTRNGVLDIEARTVQPLKSIRAEVTAPDRVRGSFTIGAAILVVLLSGLGFYATQHYLVSSGRREFAIRASLGAAPGALGRLVILRGIVLGLPGLVLGGLLAFIVVAWLRGDFISTGVSPVSVTLLVLTGLAALLVAASLGPAREARRTQPAPLLRED